MTMCSRLFFLTLATLCFSELSRALPDDLCPRLEGIDLECSTVRPPPGGGGGGQPAWGGGCGPPCIPGFECNGGPGVGGGGGNGVGPGIGPAPGPDACEDRPTTCHYIRTGSAQTLTQSTASTKETASSCVRTISTSPELPDTFRIVEVYSNCKVETPVTCYLNGDRMTKEGTQQPCTGQITCPPADAGWDRVGSADPCPTINVVNLPLCSSLTTPPRPRCPP